MTPRSFLSPSRRRWSRADKREGQVLLIHALGRPATGDLKRPFATAGGFMGTTPAVETTEATVVVEAVEAKKDQ